MMAWVVPFFATPSSLARPPHSKQRLALGLGLCFLLCVGCNKSGSPEQLGDAVGVQLDINGVGVEVALAVAKGQNPDQFVAPFAGSLHKAFKACPDAVPKDESTSIYLKLDVLNGQLTAQGDPPEGPSKCLLAQLNGQTAPKNVNTPLHAQIRRSASTKKPLKTLCLAQ